MIDFTLFQVKGFMVSGSSLWSASSKYNNASGIDMSKIFDKYLALRQAIISSNVYNVEVILQYPKNLFSFLLPKWF